MKFWFDTGPILHKAVPEFFKTTTLSKHGTGEEMYLWRNNDVLSQNHCCHGKIIIVTYSEYVSVALVIQQRNNGRNVLVRI